MHFSVAFVKQLLCMCKEQWIIPANKVGSDLWKQDIVLAFVSFILVKVKEWLLCLLLLRTAELLKLSGLAVLWSVFAVEEGLFNSTVHSRVQICAGWLCVYLCPGWWQTLWIRAKMETSFIHSLLLMSLAVIAKNWGTPGCAWAWKGPSESCSTGLL